MEQGGLRAQSRTTWAGLVAVGLAGCAAGPVETARSVPAEPRVVLERLRSELAAQGFQLAGGGPDGLEARTEQAAVAWAVCSPALVSAGDDRRLMTTAERRRAEVEVQAVATGAGTSVKVVSRFDATYRNRLRGTGFERPCRSTGDLERLLLEAATG